MNILKNKLESKLGFFTFAVILFWLKTLFVYMSEFQLGVTGLYQNLILLINPLASTILFFSIGLFFTKSKRSYRVLLFTYFLMSLLLYANVLYYREFTDFITLTTITGNVGGSGNNFSVGLANSFFVLFRAWDFVYWIDWFVLLALVYMPKFSISLDQTPVSRKTAISAVGVGALAFVLNLGLAEIDRPQLLTRTFDRNYIVKYLGLNFYQGYDAFQTIRNNRIRANADEGDTLEAVEYADQVRAVANDEYFGIAKGRNVFTLVMESAQQFAIDYQVEGADGQKYEVTPFMNRLYHDPATLSFSNYFHQTGQGKSSDAEILSENSLFGLPEGAAFQTVGSTNTFYATPNILEAEAGYTSAAFHGNVGSFWNRTDTYQRFGYDYFFDANFYDMSPERTVEYGLTDKLMFHDSVKYIEQLPQPFYTKFLTLTNHFPYPLDEANSSIPPATTGDKTINNYFVTLRYSDEAIEEFINWTKKVGLYENSIFAIYGDHYGISNMRNPKMADILGVQEWTDYHNNQMQRVPLMFHIPGFTGGKVVDTVGGQVDYLPTLLHLLGIKTEPYLFMGQDLLSPENDGKAILRNGQMITDKYVVIGTDIYDAHTGELLNDQLTEEELEAIYANQQDLSRKLDISDKIMTMDLFRFYTPKSFKNIQHNGYLYQNQLTHLRQDSKRDTNLLNKLGVQTTQDLYETNAPELNPDAAKTSDDQLNE